MKTCLECNTLFKRDVDLTRTTACPLEDCDGEIVEIDDNILLVILKLNHKGYRTDYCCAGHPWSYRPYILFASNVHPESFSSLPKNFNSEITDDNRLHLFRNMAAEGEIERQKCIMESSIHLMEWVEDLPHASLVKVEFILNEGTDLLEFEDMVRKALNLEVEKFSPIDEGQTRANFFTFTGSDRTIPLSRQIKTFASEMSIFVSVDVID
jgi:hypothetical protein